MVVSYIKDLLRDKLYYYLIVAIMNRLFEIFVLSLATVVPVVIGGTDMLIPDSLMLEKQHVLQLLYNLCLSGKVPEVGLMSRFVDNERSHVYCRQQAATSMADSENGGTSSLPQAIFVQSPPLDQKHQIVVKAATENSNAPKTNVYVVPPKIKNRYNVDLLRQEDHNTDAGHMLEEADSGKPAVYFIGGNGIQTHPTSDTTKPSESRESVEEEADDEMEYADEPDWSLPETKSS